MHCHFHNPVSIHSGPGMRRQIGALAAKYGKKALIVTTGSAHSRALAEEAGASLEAAGLGWAHYNGIRPNPLGSMAAEGAQAARDKLCDLVAEADDELMMKYLEGEEQLTQNELESLLDKAIAQELFIPVFVGSTIIKQGIQGLMEDICTYFPHPRSHGRFQMADGTSIPIDETNRRREIQQKYNEEHGITPQTIKKAVRDLIAISKAASAGEEEFRKDPESMDARELEKLAKELTKKMRQAAAELNFEEAAKLRDRMKEVKQMLLELEKN